MSGFEQKPIGSRWLFHPRYAGYQWDGDEVVEIIHMPPAVRGWRGADARSYAVRPLDGSVTYLATDHSLLPLPAAPRPTTEDDNG